jgi:two-component system cell cycle response regulator DivK
LAYTILIVEEDKLNMKLFNDVLQTNGYDTIQVMDGHDILQLAQTNKPDLLIMDTQFQDISGGDLIKSLKADNELMELPVIAVTAHAMEGDEARLIGEGYNGYIAKPFSIPVFLEKIAKFLN